MTKDQEERLFNYAMSRTILKQLLNKKLITKKQFELALLEVEKLYGTA